MSINKQLLLIIFSIFFYNIWCAEDAEPKCLSFTTPVLVVIALDGFKNSYYQYTEYLKEFRGKGVYTNLKTLTVSNALNTFHTVATGLTTQKHGVVGHNFYNSMGSDKFEYSEKLYKYKNTKGPPVIPIWILNEMYNGISGCMMWPGAEFPYRSRKPTYVVEYNKKMKLEDRFETIKKWFDKPKKSTWPNLVMIYIEEPDKTAHINSPDIDIKTPGVIFPNQKLKDKLKVLDDALKNFNDELKKIDGLEKRLNIVYLSDHSMGNVREDKIFDVEKNYSHCKTRYDLNVDVVQAIYINTHQPTPPPCLWDKFDSILADHRESNADRIGSWNMILPKGMAYKEPMKQYIAERENFDKAKFDTVGTTKIPKLDRMFGAHGWVNDNEAIFMAQGPAFITGAAKPFEMYDFYSLFGKVLKIKRIFNKDGNFTHVKPLLKRRVYHGVNWIYRFLIILACAIVHCTVLYFYGNAKIRAMEKERKERASLRRRNPRKSIFSTLE